MAVFGPLSIACFHKFSSVAGCIHWMQTLNSRQKYMLFGIYQSTYKERFFLVSGRAKCKPS